MPFVISILNILQELHLLGSGECGWLCCGGMQGGSAVKHHKLHVDSTCTVYCEQVINIYQKSAAAVVVRSVLEPQREGLDKTECHECN